LWALEAGMATAAIGPKVCESALPQRSLLEQEPILAIKQEKAKGAMQR